MRGPVLVQGEAVAALLLGALKRGLAAAHDVGDGGRVVLERDPADRDGDMELAALGFDPRQAHGREDLLGGDRQIDDRGVAEHDAEPVGTDPADDVGVAQAAIEHTPDRDHDRIRGLDPEGFADSRQTIDADHEIGARDPVAPGRAQRVVQRLAQPAAIVVPGELVVVGEIFELRFARLARADHPHHAGDAGGLSGGVVDGDAAIMDPDRIVMVVADAELAFEGLRTRPGQMAGDRRGARRRILAVDAGRQRVGGPDRGELRPETGRIGQPVDGAGLDIP